MVMTDVSGSTKRADALGKLGVSYGVGMVVGPTVGGYITSLGATESQGTHLAASAAAAVCAVAMVIVLASVPRSTKDPARIARTDSKENKIYGMFVVHSVLPSLLEALKFSGLQRADHFDLLSRWSIEAMMCFLLPNHTHFFTKF